MYNNGIFYIIDSFIGSKGNGIASQAMTWASLLKKYNDIQITLVNSWNEYDYKCGDIVHLFGSTGIWFYDVARNLKNIGCKVVWSPICDNIDLPWQQRIKTFVGSEKIKMFSLPMIRKKALHIMDKVVVRSNFEKDYIHAAYGLSKELIEIIPLAMSYTDDDQIDNSYRDRFCLHISSIYQERKNVLRLVKAAKKYNFPLILAGNKGSDAQFADIEKEINGANNIEVKGFVSEAEKILLYKKAKVFALPSIMEGVGIVAVDAAHYGCEVVITNVGGPKEYFGNFAFAVDPYSVDNIGKSIITAMDKGFQPELKKYVDAHYNHEIIANKLLETYYKT